MKTKIAFCIAIKLLHNNKKKVGFVDNDMHQSVCISAHNPVHRKCSEPLLEMDGLRCTAAESVG